jgi:thermostable 8-oxoguanine DNA glycosylase
MVDAKYATKFDRNDNELEEFLIFCVCVANKDATRTAKSVHELLAYLQNFAKVIGFHTVSPLQSIILYSIYHTGDNLRNLLYTYKITPHVNKTIALLEVIAKKINPRTCTVEDLEAIKGIGSKTARYFLLHSRPGLRLAVLDTHILKWLRDQGVNTPKSTPPKGSARYKELELTFLALADKLGKSPAELDLAIWNEYSKNGLKSTNVREPISTTKATKV